MRSRILLVGLVLTPAALVATGYSSHGEAKGDDCKAKPDSSSPAGMHWYYRVDRANNRHCWYLHEQGMRVHSQIESRSRPAETEDDAINEPNRDAAPVTAAPQPQRAMIAEPEDFNFTTRWVELPKSADLTAHEPVGASNGYAPEQEVASAQEQLPPALAGVSAVNNDARQNTGPQTNFGSISLAGAVVLALLLISEALIRFVRASGWMPRRRVRVRPAHYREASTAAVDATPDRHWRGETASEPMAREHAGVRELQRLLHRAGSGLRPPRSFAPSRPAPDREHADHARAHSAFERLKSRTFSGMTWAPL